MKASGYYHVYGFCFFIFQIVNYFCGSGRAFRINIRICGRKKSVDIVEKIFVSVYIDRVKCLGKLPVVAEQIKLFIVNIFNPEPFKLVFIFFIIPIVVRSYFARKKIGQVFVKARQKNNVSFAFINGKSFIYFIYKPLFLFYQLKRIDLLAQLYISEKFIQIGKIDIQIQIIFFCKPYKIYVEFIGVGKIIGAV